MAQLGLCCMRHEPVGKGSYRTGVGDPGLALGTSRLRTKSYCLLSDRGEKIELGRTWASCPFATSSFVTSQQSYHFPSPSVGKGGTPRMSKNLHRIGSTGTEYCLPLDSHILTNPSSTTAPPLLQDNLRRFEISRIDICTASVDSGRNSTTST